MFYYYDSTFLILIPAILFTMWAQGMVSRNFRRFSQVRNQKNLTGAEAARKMLDYNGLSGVGIRQISGSLTDHYDPRTRVLSLSQDVYGVASVAAVSVACHEAGHAIQHAKSYGPLKIRNAIVPIVNFASRFSWLLLITGILLLGVGDYQMVPFGNLLFNIGVIAFVAVIVFHLITLPVEFDASRRAINKMEELGLVAEDDIPGSKKVLRAAAMTYVAALAMAVANLLRILAIRGRRD
ncbi:MAG: zinc metallopeptidase [Emergencia sp.]|nr:zinc metallopeptidase [Emergencia sp.]